LPDVTNVTAHVWPTWSASEWTRACRCGEALSTSIHRKDVATTVVTNARAVVLLFIAREFLIACRSLQLFFRNPGHRVGGFPGFVPPKMKRISEDDVTEDAAEIVVTEINRGIKLKIACDVAGKTDGR
jgi:hypothetical protein